MKVIEITTHKAVAWTYKEEAIINGLIRNWPDLHRLHRIAYNSFPDREKEAVRRKVYRLRMDREYIDTVNNVRTELLGA